MNADELVQVKPNTTVALFDEITQNHEKLKKALPDNMSVDKLISVAMSCCRANNKLYNCTPSSFIGALFMSAQLGLEPLAGMSYLLPFWNNKKKCNEVQFILGYKGMISLFYRHARSVSLNSGVVYENDEFDFQNGTHPYLNHKELDGDRGKVKGYWVCAKLINDGVMFKYMTHEKCMEHAKKHSKTWDKDKKSFSWSSPWRTATESMCLKTVVIQLAKLMPISVDLQRYIQADESIRIHNDDTTNILDEPDETNWNDIPDEDIAKISEGMD